MSKLFCLMGKSASGKDSIYGSILKHSELSLHTIIPCTTRPMRQGEVSGREYYFYSEEALQKLEKEGRIIELRSYNTVHGIWKYFTADDGQIDLSTKNYLIIGTLASYLSMQNYFGKEKLVPLYVYTEDGLRLTRALERERQQALPRYAEMCRRFLADEEDFSEDKLQSAGIDKRFFNQHLDVVTQEIITYIKTYME